jgi:hypothetical protein
MLKNKYPDLKEEEIKASLKEEMRRLLRSGWALDTEDGPYDTESQTYSHLFGNPYFEAGEAWPVNPNSKNPLTFVFQIVDSPQTPLPEGMGLFQFFLDRQDVPWSEADPGYLVKVYPQLDPGKMVSLEKPRATLSQSETADPENPITVRISGRQAPYLPHNEDRSHKAMDLMRSYDLLDNGEDAFDLWEELAYELGVNELDSANIGAWPQWLSASEWPLDEEEMPLPFLLEMDGGFPWCFMTGMYWFLDPEAPQGLRFIHHLA